MGAYQNAAAVVPRSGEQKQIARNKQSVSLTLSVRVPFVHDHNGVPTLCVLFATHFVVICLTLLIKTDGVMLSLQIPD